MKKGITASVLIPLLLLLCSCSSMVSYIRFESDEDGKRYNSITEVPADAGKDAVIFYSDEELYDVAVLKMEYDAEKNEYRELETLWAGDVLSKGDGLKIRLDLSADIPYISVRYTRKNGETREQFIYQKPSTGKLWLLEQKN